MTDLPKSLKSLYVTGIAENVFYVPPKKVTLFDEFTDS